MRQQFLPRLNRHTRTPFSRRKVPQLTVLTAPCQDGTNRRAV